MTSSRLPGKVILPALGKPLLQILVERLKMVKSLNSIVIATTYRETDDPLGRMAKELSIQCYRGSEKDVLGRVLGAAKTFDVDIIVEITADCPLIDPGLSERCINEYRSRGVDYCALDCNETYPLGFSVQVFSTQVLSECDRDFLNDPQAREHVSWPIYNQPQKYKIFRVTAPMGKEYPRYRISLDNYEDYVLIKNIYESLYSKNPNFTLDNIVEYLKKNPKLAIYV